jgi:hypothetical protein
MLLLQGKYQERYPSTQFYPWAIARLGAPDEKSRIVGRFMNRQDAEDSLRLLDRMTRLLKKKSTDRVVFVIIFDAAEDIEDGES